MKGERPEVVRGSGNAFRDLGCESADAGQFKAILAAEIIRTLDPDVAQQIRQCMAAKNAGKLMSGPSLKRGQTANFRQTAPEIHVWPRFAFDTRPLRPIYYQYS